MEADVAIALPTVESSFRPSLRFTSRATELSVWNCVLVEPPSDVLVAPGLTVGATDARRFLGIADDVYRFLPLQLTEAERAGFHGLNERVKLDNLALFPAFYRQVIRRGAGG